MIEHVIETGEARPIRKKTAFTTPHLSTSKDLSKDQHQQLSELLDEYNDVLQSTPGRTAVIKHVIETREAFHTSREKTAFITPHLST